MLDVELGQRVLGVEGVEAIQRRHGSVLVLGQVEPVELLQHGPGLAQLGVSGEESLQAGLLSLLQSVRSAQGQEPGAEHRGLEGRLDPLGLSPLDAPAHLHQAGREPANDVEAVNNVGGMAQVGSDGGAVGLRAV